MKKQELYNELDKLCVKCLVRFGYWMIKITEECAMLANSKHPGIFKFGPAEALTLRNNFIEHATDGEAMFKAKLLRVLWSIPEMWPTDFEELAYSSITRELSKAVIYCKGDGFIGHKEEVAVKFNLGSKKGTTIGHSEARPNVKEDNKRIWVPVSGDKKEK